MAVVTTITMAPSAADPKKTAISVRHNVESGLTPEYFDMVIETLALNGRQADPCDCLACQRAKARLQQIENIFKPG